MNSKAQFEMTDVSDRLLTTDRLALDGTKRNSVVVVGLPRSGSSFLSHVLSQVPGWYVFDDLYLARAARQAKATGPLNDADLDHLLEFLGWQIWARKRYGTYAIPNMTEEEIEPMNAALRETFAGKGITWTDLQEEWLIRLGERSGAVNWGFKMPGAFRQLESLLKTYPEMKVVFLMRSPEKVMASYKHLPEESEDGNADQYHPVTHSVYWRMAARAWLDAKKRWPERVMLLRFEDLVADPTAAGKSLAAHLEAPIPDVITAPERPNSSFSGKRAGLTRLEQKIVHVITASERKALGFAPAVPEEAEGGVADFIWTTGRFLRHHGGRFAGRLRRKVKASRSG